MVLTAAAEPPLWNGLSLTTLALGLLAFAISAIALVYTARSANAAAAQTKLQQQIAIDAAQPYVWADLRPDVVSGVLVYVVVANSGPTVATNVRVTFNPPLKVSNQQDRVDEFSGKLKEGLSSLPPGRHIQWNLDAAPSLAQAGALIAYTVRVEADGPAGPVKPLEYVISLDDIGESSGRPEGSLYETTKAIKELPKR